MMNPALTSPNNYFEDFTVGRLIRHARGKTVTEMNTAEGHFNEDRMRRAGTSPNAIFNQRVVFGGINLSMVIGLASQDTAEQCIREVGLTNIKLSHPVFHGDTLYAYSEVLAATEDLASGGGLVRFRHYGVNQNRKLCVQAERTVLLRKRVGTPA
jgi:itaconyl-CoA hydratase